MNELKIETWADSGGCYAMTTIQNCIFIVDINFVEGLSIFLKPNDDEEDWFMPEDMVVSTERENLTERSKEIYDALYKALKEHFQDSYIFD